jgi:tetratricopeptide (TPR) repeat protein
MLANSSGATQRHSNALAWLALIECRLGDYFASQGHAQEAQRLARISANFYNEAQALHIEAMAWMQLGNYKKSISLCTRARDFLVLCELSDSSTDHDIMDHQATIHSMKSEYREAHNI